jgi:hypothetical protein
LLSQQLIYPSEEGGRATNTTYLSEERIDQALYLSGSEGDSTYYDRVLTFISKLRSTTYLSANFLEDYSYSVQS